MNIVTSKKIIASMIIAIMLIGVTSPIFAATTNATVKTKTYIYSSESTGSTKKAEIYKGQTVRVSSINGNWCKISWQVTAYAHKNFVNKNGEVKGGGPNLYSDQKHTKQIGDLKTGKLTILENKKLYDNNYYKVSVNVTGYMKKTDLNIATSTTSNKPASSSSNSSGSTISILSSLLDISFGVASGIFEGLFSIFGGIGSPGEGEQPLKEKTLKLNKTSAEVKVDNTITLTATYNGKTVKPIYKSSNTKIATIDSNGKIKGIAQGETTITATYNGKKATCKVTVTAKTQTSSSIYEPQTDRNKNWGYRRALKEGTLNHAICFGEYFNKNHDYRNRITIDPETNIVIVDNEYYCAAIGTYFGNVGDKFIVKLSSGKVIKIIMCDAKGTDAYFKAENGKTIAHKMNNGCKDMLEFYCDGACKTKKMQEKFAGKVESITKL